MCGFEATDQLPTNIHKRPQVKSQQEVRRYPVELNSNQDSANRQPQDKFEILNFSDGILFKYHSNNMSGSSTRSSRTRHYGPNCCILV